MKYELEAKDQNRQFNVNGSRENQPSENNVIRKGNEVAPGSKNIPNDVEAAILYYTETSRGINELEREGYRERGNGYLRIEEQHGRVMKAWLLQQEGLPGNDLYRGVDIQLFSKTIFGKSKKASNFREDCRFLGADLLTKKYGNLIFKYPQFVSTTRERRIAQNFANGCILEIYAPRGTKGADISKLSKRPEEKEVLLMSNLTMQFDRFWREENILHIKVTVVG